MVDQHGFGSRAAFQMAMRVHRGGGFVKDAVYLRGLQQVVGYLADGGRLDTLLVGKIALNHVAVIEELQRRGVLVNPPLRPAYLDDPDTYYRLERLARVSPSQNSPPRARTIQADNTRGRRQWRRRVLRPH